MAVDLVEPGRLQEYPEQGEADHDAGHRRRQPGEEIERAAPEVTRAHHEIAIGGKSNIESTAAAIATTRVSQSAPRKSVSCRTLAQCAVVKAPSGTSK